MTAAKSKSYYLGLDSVSGKLRSLFLTGYDSFDAWEKDQRAAQKDPTLGPAIERALAADGALRGRRGPERMGFPGRPEPQIRLGRR